MHSTTPQQHLVRVDVDRDTLLFASYRLLEAAFELSQSQWKLERLLSKMPPDAAHADDTAISGFASALSAKMAEGREKGRNGWQTCPVPDLWAMLQDHVEKGDPRDVALLAMMIWHNEQDVNHG